MTGLASEDPCVFNYEHMEPEPLPPTRPPMGVDDGPLTITRIDDVGIQSALDEHNRRQARIINGGQILLNDELAELREKAAKVPVLRETVNQLTCEARGLRNKVNDLRGTWVEEQGQ